MNIRELASDDAAEFHSLRTRAVVEAPSAFGTSEAEELALSTEDYVRGMQEQTNEGGIWLGAFDDKSTLIGTCCFRRESKDKLKHRGWIWGAYVLPHYRGKHVGRQLLESLLKQLENRPGLEQAVLHVTVGNLGARKLYVRLGFLSAGIEPRALRVGNEYYDQETMYLSLGS